MYLYIRHENKKAWMAANKDHRKPIEQWLWHGTKKEFVDGIIRNGFTKIKIGNNGNMRYTIMMCTIFPTPTSFEIVYAVSLSCFSRTLWRRVVLRKVR